MSEASFITRVPNRVSFPDRLASFSFVFLFVLGMPGCQDFQVESLHEGQGSNAHPTSRKDIAPHQEQTNVVHFDHCPLVVELPAHELQIVEKLDVSKIGRISASQALHLLNAFGLEAQFQDTRFQTGRDLLRLFTDSRVGNEYFGSPVMLETRYGLRPTSGRAFGTASQVHRDQVLSCFATLGIPLTTTIENEGQNCTIEDVLRDSIASFRLNQEEIEFTAIAYAHYLIWRQHWENKFGDRFTFDDLVGEILQRDRTVGCCCGVHLEEALILLSRADQEYGPLLTETVRTELNAHIISLVAQVIESQSLEGDWGSDWTERVENSVRSSGRGDLSTRILATGHITQCLSLLKSNDRKLEIALKRAIHWLDENTHALDQNYILENFCPCTHAAWCLKGSYRNGLGRRPSSGTGHDGSVPFVALTED